MPRSFLLQRKLVHIRTFQGPFLVPSRPFQGDGQAGHSRQKEVPFQEQAALFRLDDDQPLPFAFSLGELPSRQGRSQGACPFRPWRLHIPSFVHITEARLHDSKVARILSLPQGSIVDFDMLHRWTERKVFFVTRMKKNLFYIVARRHDVPINRNILSERTIHLSGTATWQKYPYLLRRIVVWDKKKQEKIALLSNYLDFSATTISSIYKGRWQIEIFFNTLKQNLKVKTFIGSTKNALRIQI